jgi:hypothetical protein
MGNPYMRFDEGTEVERPPPTLLWAEPTMCNLVVTFWNDYK